MNECGDTKKYFSAWSKSGCLFAVRDCLFAHSGPSLLRASEGNFSPRLCERYEKLKPPKDDPVRHVIRNKSVNPIELCQKLTLCLSIGICPRYEPGVISAF